jgi:hypothetical protein
MSIPDRYTVQPIKNFECKEWLLEKHYAHRIPSISLAYGLYSDTVLHGICTYGMPCRVYNRGGEIFDNQLDVTTLELNRLCVTEGLEKNVLSFFVTQTFPLLPKPICLVSYADPNAGHHGYIYQATNWIYTGVCEPGGNSYDWILDGKYLHGRNITMDYIRHLCGDKFDPSSTKYDNFERIGGEIKSQEGKQRYFQLLGNRRETKQMKRLFKYSSFPYPKGDNTRYDASYEPITQGILF